MSEINFVMDEDIPTFVDPHGMMSAVEDAILDEHDGKIRTFEPSVLVAPDAKFVFKGAMGPKHVLSRDVSLISGNVERGIHKIQGAMILVDRSTGVPVAIFNGNREFTGHRTGAAGAAIARHIMPEDIGTVMIFGSGDEAQFQFDYLAAVRDQIEEVLVWSRNPENARHYVEMQRGRHRQIHFDVIDTDGIQDACGRSQMIITATAATAPLFDASWVKPGTHITAVGADIPGKREIPSELVMDPRVQVVVDSFTDSQVRGVTQGVSRNARVYEAWEVLRSQGPAVNGATTIWAFSGRGAWDLAAAEYCAIQNRRPVR